MNFSFLHEKGPIIDALFIDTDGKENMIKLDTTPSKNEIVKILGGLGTFIGQWEDEFIVAMKRRDDEDLPINQYHLPSPLDKEEIRGPILIIKMCEREEDVYPIDLEFNEYKSLNKK